MNEARLLGLGAIAPELMLVFVSLVVLVMDLVMRGRDSDKLGWASLVGLGVTGFMLIARFDQPSGTALGMVAIDKFGSFFKIFTVAALAVVIYFVMSDRRERKHGVGEYYFLLLGAGIGIFFMVGTNNLLLLMLGLELLSLASYSLAGFHKGEKRSAEAAMKYVVFGGLSAGVMLYGISLLYGLTGTLDLAVMAGGALGVAGDADTLHRSLGVAIEESPGMVGVAIVLILSGFAYKITLAPFHFWAPDVYDGAPTPVTTFLAVTSKAAGFGAMLRFLWVLFGAEGTQAAVQAYGLKVGQLIAVLAAVTMTLGNLAALRQESIKRMLAYSSIAHAGYVLMGVVAMTLVGFQASLFYLAAYYFMNLGAFGFLLYFQGVTGKDTYESIKGMGYSAPLVSIAMVVFLVSLTGIPPTVGFAGKYMLFAACIQGGFLWLAVVAGINSAVSLFYYIKVARYLFLSGPTEKTAAPQPGLVGFIAVLAVLTVLFGIYFSPLIEFAREGMQVLTAGL